MKNFQATAALLCLVTMSAMAYGQAVETDGFLNSGAGKRFPLGTYDMPETDEELAQLAAAGFNVVRCGSRAELDRLAAAGMQGIISLSMQEGLTDAMKARIAEVADHPAIAAWEGPDEVVWNFTAFSGLHRTMGIHKHSGEWWLQTPEAIAYAEQQAAVIMPNMRAVAEHIRATDLLKRPVWINEAQRSDAYYVRQYLDFVSITGCDVYPVKKATRDLQRIGQSVAWWNGVGEGKSVWMVLQNFSWHELGEYYAETEVAYPTFAESRFMAYDSIARGARGILYWGGRFCKSGPFKSSVNAVVHELNALQPFLVAPNAPEPELRVHELTDAFPVSHVYMAAKRVGDDWLIIVVNEDNAVHSAVEIAGLASLEGRRFYELYGNEERAVTRGAIMTRLMGFQAKVYVTDRRFEVENRGGRDFVE